MSTESPAQLNLLIASYLEPEYIAQIRAVDARLNVIYAPELLPVPRYLCDHVGTPRDLTPAQEQTWREYLRIADIQFDFDYVRRAELPELAPNLRWLQATSAGIGQLVKKLGYDTSMPNTIFTTASGVHAIPLAEWCMMSILNHYRNMPLLLADQRAHRWERYATTDLVGKTVAIVGLGNIGREITRLAKAFGMKVIGSRASDKPVENVDRMFRPEQLDLMLPLADIVVMIAPHTPATEQLFDQRAFAAMREGAFFINIGRGASVDETALLAALQSGKLAGAALDVFAKEPLPADSPFWDMPQVMVSPHSASTSDKENQRITDLFRDNLRRFLNDEPLRNVLDVDRLY